MKYTLFAIIVITLTVGGIIVLSLNNEDKLEDKYPQAKTIYVDTCLDSNNTKYTCACTYDYMDKHLSNDQFQELLGDMFVGNKSDISKQANKYCNK